MTAYEIDIDATENSNLEVILAKQAGMSRLSSIPYLLDFPYNMLWNMTGNNADFWKPRLLYCKHPIKWIAFYWIAKYLCYLTLSVTAWVRTYGLSHPNQSMRRMSVALCRDDVNATTFRHEDVFESHVKWGHSLQTSAVVTKQTTSGAVTMENRRLNLNLHHDSSLGDTAKVGGGWTIINRNITSWNK